MGYAVPMHVLYLVFASIKLPVTSVWVLQSTVFLEVLAASGNVRHGAMQYARVASAFARKEIVLTEANVLRKVRARRNPAERAGSLSATFQETRFARTANASAKVVSVGMEVCAWILC